MEKIWIPQTENIVGKEENAGYQRFLLFLQYYFIRFPSFGPNMIHMYLTLYQTVKGFNNPGKEAFWKL